MTIGPTSVWAQELLTRHLANDPEYIATKLAIELGESNVTTMGILKPRLSRLEEEVRLLREQVAAMEGRLTARLKEREKELKKHITNIDYAVAEHLKVLDVSVEKVLKKR